MNVNEAINLSELKGEFRAKVRELLPEGNLNLCLTCGACASGCPATGLENMDPRKFVRMVALGMDEEVLTNPWVWMCSMCQRCIYACPMKVDIPQMVGLVRNAWPREEVPKGIMGSCDMALKHDTCSAMGASEEDFQFVVEDVAEEVAEEPGFEGFEAPIDKNGANILTTIHNKLVNTHTEDLKHWWKIFHAAKEDWTVTSENWEGTSWGYFTGDDDAMKVMAGRLLEQMEKLEVKNLLWPE